MQFLSTSRRNIRLLAGLVAGVTPLRRSSPYITLCLTELAFAALRLNRVMPYSTVPPTLPACRVPPVGDRCPVCWETGWLECPQEIVQFTPPFCPAASVRPTPPRTATNWAPTLRDSWAASGRVGEFKLEISAEV